MEEIIKKWSQTDPMLEATCMFECGELRQAISKIIEYGADDERLENLAEECGDVLICIDALMKKYGLEKAVEKWRIQKLERLDERMKVASCRQVKNNHFAEDSKTTALQQQVTGKLDGEEEVIHKCINCNYYNEYHNNTVCLKIGIELNPESVGYENVCSFWKLKGGK